METIAKSDIFFFIASFAIIIVAILNCVILFFLIKFARSLYYFLEEIKEHFHNSEDFIKKMKDNILFRFIFPNTPLNKKASRKRTVKNKE